MLFRKINKIVQRHGCGHFCVRLELVRDAVVFEKDDG